MGLKGPKTTTPAHEAKDVSVFGDMAQRIDTSTTAPGKTLVPPSASASMDDVSQEVLAATPSMDLLAKFVPKAMNPQIESILAMGPDELARGDWKIVQNVLEEAREKLEAETGGRQSWMLPAIDIAKSRATPMAADATVLNQQVGSSSGSLRKSSGG